MDDDDDFPQPAATLVQPATDSWLGFDSATPVDISCSMMAWPWVPFRGKRLAVHRDCRDFLIRTVTVGMRMMLASKTPLPADLFVVNFDDLPHLAVAVPQERPVRIVVDAHIGDLIGLPFELPVAMPGVAIELVVENLDRAMPRRFLAGWYGRALMG
jgi:hypothetical protein